MYTPKVEQKMSKDQLAAELGPEYNELYYSIFGKYPPTSEEREAAKYGPNGLYAIVHEEVYARFKSGAIDNTMNIKAVVDIAYFQKATDHLRRVGQVPPAESIPRDKWDEFHHTEKPPGKIIQALYNHSGEFDEMHNSRAVGAYLEDELGDAEEGTEVYNMSSDIGHLYLNNPPEGNDAMTNRYNKVRESLNGPTHTYMPGSKASAERISLYAKFKDIQSVLKNELSNATPSGKSLDQHFVDLCTSCDRRMAAHGWAKHHQGDDFRYVHDSLANVYKSCTESLSRKVDSLILQYESATFARQNAREEVYAILPTHDTVLERRKHHMEQFVEKEKKKQDHSGKMRQSYVKEWWDGLGIGYGGIFQADESALLKFNTSHHIKVDDGEALAKAMLLFNLVQGNDILLTHTETLRTLIAMPGFQEVFKSLVNISQIVCSTSGGLCFSTEDSICLVEMLVYFAKGLHVLRQCDLDITTDQIKLYCARIIKEVEYPAKNTQADWVPAIVLLGIVKEPHPTLRENVQHIVASMMTSYIGLSFTHKMDPFHKILWHTSKKCKRDDITNYVDQYIEKVHGTDG